MRATYLASVAILLAGCASEPGGGAGALRPVRRGARRLRLRHRHGAGGRRAGLERLRRGGLLADLREQRSSGACMPATAACSARAPPPAAAWTGRGRSRSACRSRSRSGRWDTRGVRGGRLGRRGLPAGADGAAAGAAALNGCQRTGMTSAGSSSRHLPGYLVPFASPSVLTKSSAGRSARCWHRC